MKLYFRCSENAFTYDQKTIVILADVQEELLLWLESDLHSNGLSMVCPLCKQVLCLRTQGRTKPYKEFPGAPLNYLSLIFYPFPESGVKHGTPKLLVDGFMEPSIQFEKVSGLKRIDW